MVYVVEIILSNEDIFFSASNDDGKTFGCIIKLNNKNNRLSDDPQIAASGDNVYMIQRDETDDGDHDIFFKASTDNSETFDPIIELSNHDRGAVSH